MGLCVGFSLISFVEIIYWFTIVMSRYLYIGKKEHRKIRSAERFVHQDYHEESE